MATDRSEEIRLRYRYRKLILEGKVHLSFDAARRLVGPDCAFHLYPSFQKHLSPKRQRGR